MKHQICKDNFTRFVAATSVAALLSVIFFCTDKTPRHGLPNVIIIFADDLGYNDLKCYGSETIHTPNLDRMAAEGVRFNNFYATCSVCSPSRASLLTGRYPSRCGVPFAVGGVYSDLGLQESEVTIAELLRKQGYATAAIGKWHLGIPQGFNYQTHQGFTSDSEFHPNRHGFDLFFGVAGNSAPDGSLPLLENDSIIDKDAHITTVTERYTRRAIEFISENQHRPFFIYFAHNRPHFPMMPNPRFAGKSRQGVYGDLVEETDRSTGKILEALKELGLEENTLVIFTSDNGAVFNEERKYGSNLPLRGGKGSTWEGGQRMPAIFRWPGTIPANRVCKEISTMMDIFPTVTGLAGAAMPADRIIDGKDIKTLLMAEKDGESPDDVFYYYNGLNLQAVRKGKWKLHLTRTPEMLVWWDSGPKEVETPMLFDLDADMGEQHDVAAKHPDVVQELLTVAEKARNELGAWNHKGSDQKNFDHLLGDRRSLRHLRTQTP